MTKVKKNAEVVKEVATEATVNVEPTTATATVDEPKVLGRPVNPNSDRQKRLAEMEARKTAMGGYIPLGRPKVEGSKRQQKLAEQAARKSDPNYVPAKGRPKMTEEEKIAARAERQAKFEAWKAAEMAKHQSLQAIKDAE
jgi:hypothetical protein